MFCEPALNFLLLFPSQRGKRSRAGWDAVPQILRKLDTLGRTQLQQFVKQGLVHNSSPERWSQDSDATVISQ
jgi:hypothetical protein